MIKDWNYILRHFQEDYNFPAKLVCKENYQDLIDAFKKGEIDFIDAGPLSTSMFINGGYGLPMVAQRRHDKTTYQSVFLVGKDSDIHSLEDLKGKKIAFVDVNSTSGYLLPLLHLTEKGIDDPNRFFSDILMSASHGRSLEWLAEGQVDVIAIADFYYKSQKQQLENKIRVLDESLPISMGTVVYNTATIDPATASQVKKMFLEINQIVSYEAYKGINNEEYVEIDAEKLDELRALEPRLKKMKPIHFKPPVKQVTSLFAEQKKRFLHTALLKLNLPGAVLILVFITVSFVQKRGSFRKYFTIAVMLPSCVFIFTSLLLVSYFFNTEMEASFDKTLSRIETFEREVTDHFEKSPEKIQLTTQRLANEDDLIEVVRLTREARYIGDSKLVSLNKSIIDNVLADRFYLKTSDKYSAEIYDALWRSDRTWANYQILFNFKPVAQLINKLSLVQASVLITICLVELIVFLLLLKNIKRPVEKIFTAMAINQGDSEGRTHEGAMRVDTENLATIADEIVNTNSQLREQTEILELRQAHLISSHNTMPMATDIEDHMRRMIGDIEAANPEFQKLRTTEFVGESPAFLRLIMDILIRSKDQEPVLIMGHTGTGKTGVAHAVHLLSSRGNQPFGEFNCAEFASADPLVLIGKLFGYGKNSGINNIPKEGQKGLLEEYEGGTLFFDEVEIIPPQVQQLLLLPLEGRQYNPAAGVGESKPCRVRFVFASNTQLTDELKNGSLRRDFYRRMVSRNLIIVPPLKERREDIPLLAKHFLKQWNQDHGKVLELTAEDLDALKKMNFENHDVSELKAAIAVAADRANFDEHIDLSRMSANALSIRSGQDFFDPEEKRELEALRQHEFNFGLAEVSLGYAPNAKTLTNHFRGICYKLLAAEKGGGKDLTAAVMDSLAQKLAGEGSKVAVVQKIRRKLERTCARVLARERRTEDFMYNLAQKYVTSVIALRADVFSFQTEEA